MFLGGFLSAAIKSTDFVSTRHGWVKVFARSIFIIVAVLFSHVTWAKGTAAGSTISNTATVAYGMADTSGKVVSQTPIVSAPALVKVEELIQLTLTSQDGAPVTVNSPGVNNALTFLLTNTGNGSETFSLARVNGPAPLPAGNFTPTTSVIGAAIGGIFLESSTTPGCAGFQAVATAACPADTAYVPGTNDPTLLADKGVIIYVISDVPVVAQNAQGQVQLQAGSLTKGIPQGAAATVVAAGQAPGTSFPGAGQGGGFAVVGGTSGQAAAVGSYINNGLGVTLTKSVLSVVDPAGTAVVMPGAVMTYQILVSLTGVGTANGIVVTDPMPAEVTYVPGSMAVDGVVKTDAIDADNAQFNAATAASVPSISVTLGNVAAPANVVVSFRATIK